MLYEVITQAQPLVLQQPLEMPAELSYKEAVTSEPEPMKRMLPGYSSYHTLSLLFDNALSDALKGQSSEEGEDRITSYNVCYTKLLREGDWAEKASGRTVSDDFGQV